MACVAINQRFYQSVSASSTANHVTTLSNGDPISIRECGGNAVYQNDVKVELLWGDDSGGWTVLFVTHGDDSQFIEETRTSNGTTQLKILLTNDSASTETIGLWYKGDKG